MGVTNVLYDCGFKYENPDKPYEMEGFVNSDNAVKGLEFYKALYKCCTPPGASNVYMGEGLDAFKSGQVAMHMNFAFTWPGLLEGPNVGGDKIGYFANPAGPKRAVRPARRAGHLGGFLLRQPGRRASSTSSGSPTRRAGQVVVRSAASPAPRRCSRIRASPTAALCQDVPGIDGHREGLLGRARLRRAAAGDAEARPRLCRRRPGHGARKPSTRWSRTGPRSSRTTARSDACVTLALPAIAGRASATVREFG